MRYPLLAALTLAACQPLESQPGPQGPAGPPGPMGIMGTPGVGAETSNKDGTRIRVRQTYSVTATEDGARAETPRTSVLYDTKLNAICSARIDENTVWRCLPRAHDPLYLYADSNCTQRVFVGVPNPQYVNEIVPTGNRIYRIGAELPGSTVYDKSGPCTRRMDLPRKGESVYDLSKSMQPDEFVKISGRTDEITP